MAKKNNNNAENFNELQMEMIEDLESNDLLVDEKPTELVKQNLMPLEDKWYATYRKIIEQECPQVTLFDHFPSKCPDFFDGGVYTFICNIPVIVPAQRINGLVKPDVFNRMLIASIIKPEKYAVIADIGQNKNAEENYQATPDDLQYWKNNIEAKNPNYFALKRFCEDKNIQTMETLYIDEILSKIKQMMLYKETR